MLRRPSSALGGGDSLVVIISCHIGSHDSSRTDCQASVGLASARQGQDVSFLRVTV